MTVWNAIGDLPAVEGGWRPLGGADGWSEYDRPQTEFQHRMRRGMGGADAGKVHDHITRPVREDDKRAFQLMDATTLYSRSSSGNEAVPRRHLRRQVQAA